MSLWPEGEWRWLYLLGLVLVIGTVASLGLAGLTWLVVMAWQATWWWGLAVLCVFVGLISLLGYGLLSGRWQRR
jgi:hypothetical protein